MPKRKQPPIVDIRGQWENYALTHDLPMRCETGVVFHDGSCLVCSAEQGEECLRAKPPKHTPALSTTGERERADGLTEARRIALHHSNYGHVEGNRRAVVIADDIERRLKALLTPPAQMG